MDKSFSDDYNDMIWDISNLSFNKIRAISTDFVLSLTEKEKDHLWEDLEHGNGRLLRTDEELKYYLYAYGNMHKQKMDVALSKFSWKDFENKHIQIVDWGCGQALATICFFDYLKRKDIKCVIAKIVLIEPSPEALERATTHVCPYNQVSEDTEIVTLNKCIDEVDLSEIRSKAELTMHFFSNVLDIESINLRRLARIVRKSSGVAKGKRSFLIKTCTAEDGEKFQTLGLANGNTTKDGRSAMTFFILSQRLEDQGVVLDRAFVKTHKEDLLVLEPIDGLKFGIIFLAGGKEDWDDL